MYKIMFSCPHNKCSVTQAMNHHICHSIRVEFYLQTCFLFMKRLMRKLNKREINTEIKMVF